jgi:hypothetical protein
VSTPVAARGFLIGKLERIDNDRDVDGLVGAIATLLREHGQTPT